MKKLFLLIGLIVFSSFSINADVTDSEFIEKHKDEIQNFISESGCFLKDINEYEIGVLNFENTNLTKSEKLIYLSYKHCNFVLVKPSAEGMELLFQIHPHYAIFDIKVEDFFNFSNLTFMRETGGTGHQAHEKHVLYMDQHGHVEDFYFKIFDKTNESGVLVFGLDYINNLPSNAQSAGITLNMETEVLRNESDYMFFWKTITINVSTTHLTKYIEEYDYKKLSNYFEYDERLEILKFKPILSKLIFVGGYDGGKETFSVLHKCDLDILNPSNGSNADKILKCIDQTPKEFK